MRPTTGEIVVAGERVDGVSGHIGYMLQKDNLLDWRTIGANVLFGLEIRRALTPAGIGTKAQQALGLQREQGKAARRVQTRAEREREQARQFQLRQTKRKEKHRGH